MYKFSIVALVLFLSVSGVFAQDDKDSKKPAKITVEELIAKHLESIGTPEALAAAKTRVIVGQGTVGTVTGTAKVLSGPIQLASDFDRMLFVMVFNSNEYPYEKAAYDGKNFSVGAPNGNRTGLSEYLKGKNSILEEGLFTGALSSAWPLLNVKSKKAKLDYGGAVKLGDRYLYKLKYSPRGDTLRVSMFFDPVTFRHVMTEYYYTIDAKIGVSSTDIQGQKDYYTLTEQFSDFKKVGDLTLPIFYTVTVDIQKNSNTYVQTTPGGVQPGGIQTQTPVPGRQGAVGGSLYFTLRLSQVFYNEPLEAGVFKVS